MPFHTIIPFSPFTTHTTRSLKDPLQHDPTQLQRYPVHELFTISKDRKDYNNGSNETKSNIRTCVHNNQQIEHK